MANMAGWSSARVEDCCPALHGAEARDPRRRYALQGAMEVAPRYIEEHRANGFVVVRSRKALAAGLPGPGELATEAAHRLGDPIVAGSDGHILNYRRRDNRRGMHPGLSSQELLVPLLLVRLD